VIDRALRRAPEARFDSAEAMAAAIAAASGIQPSRVPGTCTSASTGNGASAAAGAERHAIALAATAVATPPSGPPRQLRQVIGREPSPVSARGSRLVAVAAIAGGLVALSVLAALAALPFLRAEEEEPGAPSPPSSTVTPIAEPAPPVAVEPLPVGPIEAQLRPASEPAAAPSAPSSRERRDDPRRARSPGTDRSARAPAIAAGGPPPPGVPRSEDQLHACARGCRQRLQVCLSIAQGDGSAEECEALERRCSATCRPRE
jgi:hypothetical protein